MSAIDDLDDALLAAELHLGEPGRRRELAATLLSEGLSAAVLDDLAGYARKSFSATKRAGGLVNLLLDRERRDIVLADLAKVARLKASRKTPEPGQRDRVQPESPDQWDETDFARRVYCRVRGDAVPIEQVATEFGLGLAEAKHLLAAGAEKHKTDLPDWASPQSQDAAAGIKARKSTETEESHEDRLARFRADMAARRRKGATL